jgi:hypothetical protein
VQGSVEWGTRSDYSRYIERLGTYINCMAIVTGVATCSVGQLHV